MSVERSELAEKVLVLAIDLGDDEVDEVEDAEDELDVGVRSLLTFLSRGLSKWSLVRPALPIRLDRLCLCEQTTPEILTVLSLRNEVFLLAGVFVDSSLFLAADICQGSRILMRFDHFRGSVRRTFESKSVSRWSR